MKLPTRPISMERQIKSSGLNSLSKPDFSVGKKISASIVEVQGDSVLLKIGDKLINARNTSSENLFVGLDAMFEVVKSSDEVIEIRPTALSQMSNAETDLSFVKSTLSEMGVALTEENIEILIELMKSGVLISKGNFDSSKLLYKQVSRVSDILFGEESAVENSGKLNEQSITGEKLFNALKMSFKELLGNSDSTELLKNLVKEYQNFASGDVSFKNDTEIRTQNLTGESISVEEQSDNTIDKSLKSDVLKISENIDGTKNSENLNKNYETGAVKNHTDKEIIMNFLKTFKDITNDKRDILKSLSFLSKNGIKPNIMNISLVKGFLLGRNGVSEAVLKLFENPEKSLSPQLKEAFQLFKAGLIDSSKLEQIDSKDLENLFKSYANLTRELENFSSANKEGRISQSDLLQQNSILSKDMSPIWSNFVIPFVNSSKVEDIEIFVKKDGNGASSNMNSDDRLVYLSLKTHSMDRIKVRIDYKPKSLKLIFFAKEGKVSDFVRGRVDFLRESLQKFISKQVSVSVNSDFSDISLIGFEYLGSASSVSKIDFRV